MPTGACSDRTGHARAAGRRAWPKPSSTERYERQGLDVVTDLGLISTDMLYFAAGQLDAPGVPCSPRPTTLLATTASSCVGPAPRRSVSRVPASGGHQAPCAGRPLEPVAAHRRRFPATRPARASSPHHVRSFVDVEELTPLKVVADTANGMGGLVVSCGVRRACPVELEILYGGVGRHVSPTTLLIPSNPPTRRTCGRRLLETGADVGLAFDGDADRVFIVDERGRTASARFHHHRAWSPQAFSTQEPGRDRFCYNLICSRRRCRKSIERARRRGSDPDPCGALLHQGSRWPRREPPLLVSTQAITTSATTTEPTRG